MTASERLFLAIEQEDDQATAALLAMNPSLARSVNYNDSTPLHYVCQGGSAAIAELLISLGADVNAQNAGGLTPLHEAASRGLVPIVRLLLGAGASATICDVYGRTPLDLASTRSQDDEGFQLLLNSIGVNR